MPRCETSRRQAAAGAAPVDGATAAQLWTEFVKTPQTHGHIPDFPCAGYRYGESPLPQPRVVANVRESGAKADDAESFRRANDAAKNIVDEVPIKPITWRLKCTSVGNAFL